MLIIRRSELHYTASGIITPIGGRLVHRLTDRYYTKSTKKLARMTKKNLNNTYLPQSKDQKNYQFVGKYEYWHSVQDYNNIAPSHKTHRTNPVTRT